MSHDGKIEERAREALAGFEVIDDPISRLPTREDRAKMVALAERDPYLSVIMRDRAERAEPIVLDGARPYASAKPFGLRTFTQVGPVGRAILLIVHDRLHGIERDKDYEYDKKRGAFYLRKGLG